MASRFLPRLPALFAFVFCARLCGFASPDAAEASCDIPASELKIRDPFVFADKKSGKYYMHANGGKLSEEQEPEGRLARDAILAILEEEKPNQVEQVKIPRDRISKFFPAGTPARKMEETIVKALELYRRRQRDRER